MIPLPMYNCFYRVFAHYEKMRKTDLWTAHKKSVRGLPLTNLTSYYLLICLASDMSNILSDAVEKVCKDFRTSETPFDHVCSSREHDCVLKLKGLK